KAFYDAKTTKIFEVRQIVCARREEADAIRAEIAGGGDFEKIARARSIGHSREYGGRLPLLGWGSMDPPWEDVVYNLKPNELSPVIESKGTYEVVQLLNVKTADKPAYGPAAVRIRSILELRKQKARETAFSDELFAKYHVQLAKLDLGVDALTRGTKETTAVATWDGGRL